MNFNLFNRKPLLNTTVEVMCQQTGKTLQITSNKPKKQCRCWLCKNDSGASEAFLVEIGEGKGNVNVTYYGMDGSVRKLDKIDPKASVHAKQGLATYTADGGTFILISQENV